MPSKKTSRGKKSNSTSWFHVSKLIAVLVILVGLFGGYFVVTTVLNNLDTNNKAERLANSGKKLDELEQRFEQTDLDIQTFRDKYCWRTTEKYSDGNMYCDQRLIAVGLNKTTEVQIKESGMLLPMVEEVFDVKFYDERFGEYSSGGFVVLYELLHESSTEFPKCTIDYSALNKKMNDDQLVNNSYTIDIICVEFIKKGNVYPVASRNSPLSYAR